MSAKLLMVVAGVSILGGVVGCSDSKKNEMYDKKHDLRDDHVRSLPDTPADKPSTRPGVSPGTK